MGLRRDMARFLWLPYRRASLRRFMPSDFKGAHYPHLICLAMSLLPVSACHSNVHDNGSLRARAQQARQEGRAATVVTMAIEELDSNLSNVLQSYSTIVVRPVRMNVVQSADENYIYSWSVYRVVEEMSRRDAKDFPGCRLKPPASLSLGRDEVAVPNGGGTMTIDGVSVTAQPTGWLPSDTARTYLFMSVLCSPSVMMLPFYGREVFEVGDDGKLVLPTRGSFSSGLEFQREIDRLVTLDRLRERVQSGNQSRH